MSAIVHSTMPFSMQLGIILHAVLAGPPVPFLWPFRPYLMTRPSLGQNRNSCLSPMSMTPCRYLSQMRVPSHWMGVVSTHKDYVEVKCWDC